jgi:mycothiol S-conjugate amidase
LGSRYSALVTTTRRLLSVHAHPDDESSKGASTVAKYHDLGVHSVLVCCTGGEEGEILNPALDTPEVRDNLPELRRQELETAAAIIGYDEVIELGYRDSGMPGSEANARPDCFANADATEAVGKLVRELRRVRPQVLLTYADEQDGYPHPDHLRVHDISIPAVSAAADGNAYPELGDPWQVTKVYYSVWSKARITAQHEKFVELGLESPFVDWLDRPGLDHRVTTQVDVSDYMDVRRKALLAHATQIDPNSPLWFGLPEDVAAKVHPYDDYVLAFSSVESDEATGDLFAGIAQE